MKARNVWTLLLTAALALAAPALAQVDGNATTDAGADAGVQADTGAQTDGQDAAAAGQNATTDGGAQATQQDGADDDAQAIEGVRGTRVSADIAMCGDGVGSTGGVAWLSDRDMEASADVSRSQDVDVDEDDVLLAIALSNNGAGDIGFNDIRDVDLERTSTVSRTSTSSLDREDVFSALALGVSADSGELDALACVADMTASSVRSERYTRDFDLDEDNVLLAIALSNSVGSDLRYEDIASWDETRSVDVSEDRSVDVDREDTFLSLALGAGGSG